MNVQGSKHLTLEERDLLEHLLKKKITCKEMAMQIGKDDRTVSREIKQRRNRVKNGKYNLYGRDQKECETLKRFPYVCNGCDKRSCCMKEYKYYYEAKTAQENYKLLLRDSRLGLDISLEEKEHFDQVLKEGIDRGQSIYHIVKTNESHLRYSVRSAYRLVNNNQTIVQRGNLRRAVKLRPRNHYISKQDNKAVRIGRTYKDFLTYIAKEPFQSITEMDTVESVRAGQHKCLLTIHNTATHFMIIIVLDSKTKENVNKAILLLREQLGIGMFRKLFRITLTDRGSEFCDPSVIEMDFETGEQICRLFYCDSYSSYQKGAIEENHELLRYVIPKNTLFDFLTQESATNLASHINSFFRASIKSTPFELATAFFGQEFIDKTKIRAITPDSVILNPSLLKH